MTEEVNKYVSKYRPKNDAHLFKKGQSGNPAGRPPNTSARMMRTMFEGKMNDITNVLLKKAEEGDIQAIKLCIERVYPPLKTPYVKIDLPPPESAEAISKSIEILLQKMSDGEMNADEIKPFLEGFEAQFKAIEQFKIIPQLEELKKKVEGL